MTGVACRAEVADNVVGMEVDKHTAEEQEASANEGRSGKPGFRIDIGMQVEQVISYQESIDDVELQLAYSCR